MHDNPTIFQTFEWNLPSDQHHYERLLQALPALQYLGITALWLPPACKAGNSTGNGYDVYDLYDLGEFDQRGSRATKWGHKEDLVALTEKSKELKMDLYFDAVLNHRCGGDAKETVNAVEVDPNDRKSQLCQPKEVDVWLQYHFSGRGGKYSRLQYDWRMFNASDWDDRSQKPSIYRITDGKKCWANDVSEEWGNGDYLMFNNLDYTNRELRDDVKNWGAWVTEHLGLAGFRLDAMQHFSHHFSSDWVKHVRKNADRNIFVIGEYWNGNVDVLTSFLKDSPLNDIEDLHLYDAPLLYNLAHTSWSKSPDLRTVFKGTLVEARPNNAITLVMNHDTQKGQVMDTPIHPDFTPLAYALVLFRKAGYPCVFYGDLYGISEPFLSPPSCSGRLADLLLARKLYSHGEQVDYFSDANCIGWVRKGLSRSEGLQFDGMAVMMAWAEDETKAQCPKQVFVRRPGWLRRVSSMTGRLSKIQKNELPYRKRMNVGAQHGGEVWTDILEGSSQKAAITHSGWGTFSCQRNSVAIYVSETAEGRMQFPVNFEANL